MVITHETRGHIGVVSFYDNILYSVVTLTTNC